MDSGVTFATTLFLMVACWRPVSGESRFLATHSRHSSGTLAELSEKGYQQVASLKSDGKEIVAFKGKAVPDDRHINRERMWKKTHYRFREFQPAPSEGWESLPPGDRPKWLRPVGSVLPPHGAKIALAFRGDYHRWEKSNGEKSKGADYWYNKDNIHASIVEPLKAAGIGIQFRSYFHTFSDLSCPQYDQALVRDIKPTLYKLDHSYEDENKYNHTGNYLEYTWIEVLKLVIEDDWADFIVLLRFDVQYNSPITAWNLDWQRVNLNFFHTSNHRGLNSDLFVTVPSGKAASFLSGLLTPTKKPQMKIASFPGIGPIHDIDPIEKGVDWASLPWSFCGLVRNCTEDYNKCMIR